MRTFNEITASLCFWVGALFIVLGEYDRAAAMLGLACYTKLDKTL